MNQVIVSDSNRTPIIQIATWFCLVTSLLAFLTHATIKFYVFRSLKVESGFVLISLVFCIAQSIAVILQTEHGFGKPMTTLSNYDIQSELKSEYAATILLIASLGFSKLAVIAFVQNLTPSQLHQKINLGVGISASLWLLCSVLVATFQCPMPHPWDKTLDRCIDRFSWWNAVSILNIVTEIAIVTLELGITAQLHIARQKKAVVMSIFACRLLVFIGAAIQLAFVFHENRNPSMKHDLTLGFWRSTICNQIVQCLAIVTTCLPYTKIFMEGFESGLMRLDDLRRRGEHITKDDSRREYQLMDVSRSTRDNTINVSKSWAVQVEPAKCASSS
ncbi:hypothetical protein P153DRAFT_310072 [Dothidotthia symphoricarpi CBS 119687]|uniref:Rhodopsin domain-containing protein n=1 Tax=Dothidotthia symphoricarpi CBS 119687 TaxID=1392245 RepID=A0A6A6ARD6_9PLEO|nr:uncharacterized protein P153DRAFT_310072 [Dothidotthia symphoricarpi CBS 119687]KAF2133081.1 hypothetical protein P153DRAFT_310072 [Dothidotthia symphoricarpi CBS 119687]